MDLLGDLLPSGLSGGVALLLVVASFFTSGLTATFGVGGGVALLAVLGMVLPVAALIPVHGAIQLGSNSGRAWHQRTHIRTDIAASLAIGSLMGAAAGAFLVVQLPDAPLKILLGTFIIAITWIRLPGMQRLGRAGLTAASAVLAFGSIFVGATGPLLLSILAQILADDRKALIATQAAGMVLQHSMKVVVFAVAGFAFAAWLPLIGAMIVSGYLGTIVGTRLLDRFPEEKFRFWFKILLTLLAADMARRGLAALF